MAVYSTNQNRQMFVIPADASVVDNLAALQSAVKGSVSVGNDSNGGIYIHQLGHGGIVRSDLISLASITSATAVSPVKSSLKQVKVELKSTVNSGNPISGQDYILRVNFRQFCALSEESMYQKYGAVHAYTGMTAAKFYAEMAYSLVKNFSRLYSPLVKISADSAGTYTVARASRSNGEAVLYNAAGTDITAQFTTGIYITEATQEADWSRENAILPINFDVIPTTVTYSGDEVIWGTTTVSSVEGLGNGYNIANLEWFCMGERADQYRNVNWPYVITTKYFAVETVEYHVVDIHYAYQGTCEDIQKSEKDITIACATQAQATALIAALKAADADEVSTKIQNLTEVAALGVEAEEGDGD